MFRSYECTVALPRSSLMVTNANIISQKMSCDSFDPDKKNYLYLQV